ncbi:MAG: Na+/H+ antiporter NhaC family protein [Thermovirgaceae bacterium]
MEKGWKTRSLILAAVSFAAIFASIGAAFAADGTGSDFGALSLLPPVIAIALCIITREVIPSLFLGIWFAGTMLAGWNPVTGFGKAVEALWNNLGDPWSARIVLTSLTMGGLVGIMKVGGGIDAIVQWITRRIAGAKSAMAFTELAGFFIFFEDYVNTLVVGTTMSPITGKYKISKEKLSYIVDSTAAPIACIAGISSWIAYMVGQIGTQFSDLGITLSPYVTYIKSIPFILYNLAALALLTFVVFSGRDFGPMLAAERRARREGKILRDGAKPLINPNQVEEGPGEHTPRRVINFALPLLLLVGLIFLLLLVTGGWPSVDAATAIGEGSSSEALVYGAFGSVFLTLVLYRLQGISTWGHLFKGYMEGMRSIFYGTLILIFAWGIGSMVKQVETAGFIVALTQGVLAPGWVPLVTFVTGAVIAFCTGTSYGTMAVLMPIVVPLVHSVSGNLGLDPMTYMVPTIGAVFAGAVWGDHSSPISDTTIMSSMFTGSDHMDHVNTQIPYALLAALGAVAGYAGVAYGLPAAACVALALAVPIVIFRVISRPVEEETPTA